MSELEVTTIRLPVANVHLVRGPAGAVLVDAGTAGSVPRLRRSLHAHGIDPASLTAVVLTHGHADHGGGARLLVGSSVPVLVGAADAAVLKAGHNPRLVPTSLTARAIRPFVDRAFPPYRPDIEIAAELGLEEFGIPATALVVGGHTPGSLVVLGRGAQPPAVVGDLLRGGHLGGALGRGRPLAHYYSENAHRDLAILRRLIDTHHPSMLHVGHGGPLDATAVRSFLDRTLGRGSTRARPLASGPWRS